MLALLALGRLSYKEYVLHKGDFSLRFMLTFECKQFKIEEVIKNIETAGCMSR